MHTDPISDLLTRIRNANTAFQEVVNIPYSKMKWEVVQILKSEGFLKDIREETLENGKKQIVVWLKFFGPRQRVLSGLKRISRPGRRLYATLDDLKKIRRDFGLTVLSTSRGLLADQQAYSQKVGGELICKVW
ncbi:MAG: 30S ribosomal protein S8 [Deltaproteobacteria bacterium]|nr:30S ribosomal protein S8 [Deltaproteobacteria bacterium]